ncbi:hypothetical protein [Lelliottia sp. WAP21]|uniref:hypothetical protein n=1 Tax=Lelliottia sp. WAP21 TaxID=2877426 RepID=UPI001E31C90B|nr:hypothetical protein [Lelliottia sp. WAP21]
MGKHNPFCTPIDSTFPRWNGADIMIWKLMKDSPDEYTGQSYLYLYKDAYIKYHKDLIIKYAKEAGISPLLLAGVAWQEAGGKPDRLKPFVLTFRQAVDYFKDTKGYSNSVSVGIIAIQIRAAAETLKVDPNKLTREMQIQLSQCLQSDDFNIKVVALHLRDLILFDYPNADTTNLNQEKTILVGARYNRGIQRKKEDFVNAISKDANSDERDYISYGLAIIKREDRVKRLMES